MLFLQADEVKYLQVVRQKNLPKMKMEVVPGLYYNGKIFVRGEFFPLSEKQHVINYTRQRFTEYQEKVYILIVEERDYLILWYESADTKPLPTAKNKYFSNWLSAMDLNQLVFEMCGYSGVKGLSIQTRRRGWRTFHRCFIGSEAVSWLCHHHNLSCAHATAIGKLLLKKNYISVLTGKSNSFQNGDCLYRFRLHE